MPPVFQTSTYVQSSPGKPIGDYEYSRAANPTRTALEDALASIENGARGLAFSSGLAATDCLSRMFKTVILVKTSLMNTTDSPLT